MLSTWIRKNDGCLQPFGRFLGIRFGQMVSILVLDWMLGGQRGGKLLNWGAGSKKCSPENGRSKLKAKKCTKRVAVRALNFSTRPFCMKFRGGSNCDGPEGHNPQKWTKNAKKLLHQKIWLKVKNRVDVKKKNGRVWVFPGTFLHHQILQIVQNFHTNPAVIGVNSRTPRKEPK